uniref:Uncharacterized protein n=1 Tax=Tetranychus urticae TaxID=32264 RepID=T1L362_TETUR
MKLQSLFDYIGQELVCRGYVSRARETMAIPACIKHMTKELSFLIKSLV